MSSRWIIYRHIRLKYYILQLHRKRTLEISRPMIKPLCFWLQTATANATSRSTAHGLTICKWGPAAGHHSSILQKLQLQKERKNRRETEWKAQKYRTQGQWQRIHTVYPHFPSSSKQHLLTSFHKNRPERNAHTQMFIKNYLNAQTRR